MTIVRVGATKSYSSGWETAFGKGKKQAASATATKSTATKSTKKKPAAKSTKKKAAKKGKK